MKRILTATALMTSIATGAFAADAYTTNTINQYVPDVNVSTLSDQQVGALMSIAGSADEADKEQKMRAYLKDFSDVTTTTVTVVPADSVAVTTTEPVEEMDDAYYANTIASYLPDVDFNSLNDEQRAALISIATKSGNEADKADEMRAYLDASAG